MTHIDDWLDDPATGPAYAKEWLEHFRRPEMDKNYEWLNERKLFCTYKDGRRYRCIGCSRMGDVWLTEHFERENGYDLRIDIADCTDWEMVKHYDEDNTHVPEEVTFCRKYRTDMPVEECFEAYRVYRSYVDEGQSREVARMYAGLS